MRSGGVGEFVAHGTEGLLCADDDDLVDALIVLAEDDGLRHRMAAHNLSHPPAMDWSSTLAGFHNAYLEAASAARGTGPGVTPQHEPTDVDASGSRP